MLVGWLAGCLAAWMPKDGKGRAVAPIESFTRFQLAAIIDSSIYRIWRLGWLILIDFDGFRGIWYHNALQPGTTLRGELWPLKKALLDSSWLLSSIHRFIGSGGWAG